MSKLIYIYNPLTEEKIEFHHEAETLAELVIKFSELPIDLSHFDQNGNYSVRINGEKVDLYLCDRDIKIAPDAEVIIYPDIDAPVALLPLLMTAMSTVGSVTGISGMVGGLSAMGMSAGLAGTATLSAAGAATLGATGSLALAGAVTFAGGLATFATVVGGAMSMFSAHKPSGGTSGGEGSPGEGSPKYGWNVQPSRSDGIPIPIIYGIEKVGGNIISKSTESVPTLMWDWFNNQDEGCAFISVPLPALPYFNCGIIGAWPPVRGFGCQVDANVWCYLFVFIDILTYKDIKNFVSWILNHTIYQNNGWLSTPEKYKNFVKFVISVTNKAFRRTYWSGVFDGTWSEKFKNKNNDWNSSEFQGRINRIFSNNKISNPVDADYDDNADYDIDADFRTEIKTWLTNRFNEKRANGSGLNIYTKWHIPILQGDTLAQIFQHSALPEDDLGIYFVGSFIGLPSAVEPQYFISNIHGLTNVKEVSGMDFKVFDMEFRDKQISNENYLHQLIGLGEGECTNLEGVFIDDLPAPTIPGLDYFFLPGTNDQTFLKAEKGFTELSEYNNTVVSHSSSSELVDAGDYVDYETTESFPANNVHIRMQFNAYRMTLKGKISDLDDNPIRFYIMVGFSDSADFESFDKDDLEGTSIAGGFICWSYSLYGGMKEPFFRMYTAFPIMNLLEKGCDTTINLIPGAARVLAAFFGKYDYIQDHWTSGGLNGWQNYALDEDIRYEIHVYLQSQLEAFYIGNDKTIKIRVMRVTSHCDNNRYTDTMNIVGFDEVSYAGFDYPNLAMLGLKIRASETLNSSEPKVTAIVKGKKIYVPKLRIWGTDLYPAFDKCWFDEDAGKYRSFDSSQVGYMGAFCEYVMENNNHVMNLEYSNNPIWCLYDLMTAKRYGLGNYVEKNDLDFDWFRTMAEHCDEMVPDGTLRWTSLYDGNVTPDRFVDQDSDYFAKKKNYWDENLRAFVPIDPDSDPQDGTIGDGDAEAEPHYFYTAVNNWEGKAIFLQDATSTDDAKTYTKSWISSIEKNGITGLVTVILGDQRFNYPNGTSRPTPFTNGNPKVTAELPYMMARKRYQLNYVMDDSSSAVDVVKQLCQTFRCFPIWKDGIVYPLIDKPEVSRVVIGMGNIIKDSMSIAYKSLKDTPNVLECQFSNEEQFYEKDVRSVADPDVDVEFAIDVSKIPRKKDVKLLGITNPAVILCELRYRLAVDKQNTEVIQFSDSKERINLVAGQVFTFAHDVMVGVGQSGRIQEYIPDGSEDWILLDQPLNDYGDDDDNLKIKVSFVLGDEEYTYEYDVEEINATNRALIRVAFGDLKPANFSSYIVGVSGTVSKDYRAVLVVPSGDIVQVTAVLYNDDVYGTLRTTKLGGTSYYDATPISAKNDRITLLNTINIYRPVTNVTLSPVMDAYNNLGVKIVFTKPKKIFYTGCKIYRKIGTQEKTHIATTARNDEMFVDAGGANLPKGVLIQYFLQAQYVGDISAVSADASITLTSGTNLDPTIPYPDKVRDIKLSKTNQKSFGFESGTENTFSTRQFTVFWPQAGIIEPEEWTGDEVVRIDYYNVQLQTWLTGQVTPVTSEIFTVEPFWRRINISYEEMGLSSKAEILNVAMVRVSVQAYASNGQWGEWYSENFTPDIPVWGDKWFKQIRFMPLLGGVLVWWHKPDDATEVEEYTVDLEIYNKNDVSKKKNITTTTKHQYCFIPISVQDRMDINALWFAGVVTGYKIRVTPMNVWGKKTSHAVTDENPDEGGEWDGEYGGEEGDTVIPDWMLGASALNIEVYDNVGRFSVRPAVAEMRSEYYNYTKGLYTRINALLDGKASTGLTYSGLGQTALARCARIAYCVPSEMEFSKVFLKVNVDCRVWVEALENRLDFGQDETSAYYYYGSSASDGSLEDNELVELGSASPRHDYGWLVSADTDALASFPKSVNSRHIRLVVQPISGSSVTISEVRFSRTIVAEEIYCQKLSAFSANLGEVTAGQIRFNCPESYENPDWTLDTPLPSPTVGAMKLGTYGLFMWNSSGIPTCWLDTSTGGFVLGGDAPHKFNSNIQVSGELNIGAGGALNLMGGSLSLSSGSTINIDALGAINITGGALNIEAGDSHWNGGSIHIHSGAHSATKGIVIDPYNGLFKSANYSAGSMGSGYGLNENGTIECGNLYSRGVIRCSVFEKGTVSAIAGEVFVPQAASTLMEDITTGATTLRFPAGAFANGDYVFAKSDSAYEAITLGTKATADGIDTFTGCTRDLSGATGGAVEAWPKGTCFMKFSTASTSVGSIFLSAGYGTNKAHIILKDGSGNIDPITGGTKRVVIGDLAAAGTTPGFGSLSAKGNGLYASNCYLEGSLYLAAGQDITLDSTTNNMAKIAWKDGSTTTASISDSDLTGILYINKPSFTGGYARSIQLDATGIDIFAPDGTIEIVGASVALYSTNGDGEPHIGLNTSSIGISCSNASGAYVDLRYNNTNRIRIDGTGIGFFNHTTAGQQDVTPSVKWSTMLTQVQVDQLHMALLNLGLIYDSKT